MQNLASLQCRGAMMRQASTSPGYLVGRVLYPCVCVCLLGGGGSYRMPLERRNPLCLLVGHPPNGFQKDPRICVYSCGGRICEYPKREKHWDKWKIEKKKHVLDRRSFFTVVLVDNNFSSNKHTGRTLFAFSDISISLNNLGSLVDNSLLC